MPQISSASCSPEHFDRRGTWSAGEPSHGGTSMFDWTCPIREWTIPKEKAQLRSVCLNTTHHGRNSQRREYKTPGCQRQRPQEVLVPNSTIYILGDSMAHALWDTFACRQLAEAMRLEGCDLSACTDNKGRIECQPACGINVIFPAYPSQLAPPGSLVARHTADWMWKTLGMHECVQIHLPSGSYFRTCFVGANLQVGSSPNHLPAPQLSLLLREGWLLPGDVVVANTVSGSNRTTSRK